MKKLILLMLFLSLGASAQERFHHQEKPPLFVALRHMDAEACLNFEAVTKQSQCTQYIQVEIISYTAANKFAVTIRYKDKEGNSQLQGTLIDKNPYANPEIPTVSVAAPVFYGVDGATDVQATVVADDGAVLTVR